MDRPYGKGDTGSWIEDTGFVRRLLSDDNDDSPHQRFILQLRNGGTLLIAHNIDLAKRIPLGIGDRVHFRGMYEWNDLGGLVHWTHPARAKKSRAMRGFLFDGMALIRATSRFVVS